MGTEELIRRCAVRGWSVNNYTCYLIESGRSSGSVAITLGCQLSTCQYWLHQDKLSNAVNVLFQLVRKVRIMYGYDILDLL